MLKLELAPTSTPTRPAFEKELLATGPVTERTALERLALLLVAVRIVASVKASAEFRVVEHLVRFVDGGHFLLGVFLADALGRSLVRVVLLGELAVGALDGAVVGVAADAEDFVVVFLLGAGEEGVGFLEEGLDLWRGRVLFFGVVERVDGAGEVIGVELATRFEKEAGEGVGVQGQRFGAVDKRFLRVVHLLLGRSVMCDRGSSKV